MKIVKLSEETLRLLKKAEFMRDEEERIFNMRDECWEYFTEDMKYYHSDPGHIFESDASDRAYRQLSLKEVAARDIDKRLQSILKSYAALQREDFRSCFYEWMAEIRLEEEENS